MEATLSAILLAATFVVVTSAPSLPEGLGETSGVAVDKEKLLEFYRDRRSQYPVPSPVQYVTPCAAAAASAPLPSYAPPAYQVNVSPYRPFSPPHGYYQPPHYRSFELEPEQEMLSFSDMDHMPMARYGYAAPPAPHPASYTVPPATPGPAYGVFPNAKIGGCSVPLLFSCSPSIIPGHVVKSQPEAYGNAYRGVDGMAHHQSQDSHEEQTAQNLPTSAHQNSLPGHASQPAVHQ